MTDYLEQKYREISARTAELAPMVDEYNRLTAAAEALAALVPATAKTRAPKRGARPRSTAAASGRAKTKAAPNGRKRKASEVRGGGRTEQALSLIEGQPGVTIAELAKAMAIQKSYLYRILPSLQKDGKVARQGDGWHPAGS